MSTFQSGNPFGSQRSGMPHSTSTLRPSSSTTHSHVVSSGYQTLTPSGGYPQIAPMRLRPPIDSPTRRTLVIAAEKSASGLRRSRFDSAHSHSRTPESGGHYPAALTQWLDRCYTQLNRVEHVSSATASCALSQVREALRARCAEALATATLYSTDWSREAMPPVLCRLLADWRMRGCAQPQTGMQMQEQHSVYSTATSSHSGSGCRKRALPFDVETEAAAASHYYYNGECYEKAKGSTQQSLYFEEGDAYGYSHGADDVHMSDAYFGFGSAKRKKKKSKSPKKKTKKSKKRKISVQTKQSQSDGDFLVHAATDAKLAERRRRFAMAEDRVADSNTGMAAIGFRVTDSSLTDGMGASGEQLGGEDSMDASWRKMAIKGISSKLEKSYFRLTTAPLPSEVRSVETCARVLEYLRMRWRNRDSVGENGCDYAYIGEQFKSLRQDLRVQHVRDSLAAAVYELNARICLEVSDMSEFNQCLSQLWDLYSPSAPSPNTVEFVCLRLLYCAVSKAPRAFYETMKRFAALRTDAEVRRAADVFTALYCNKYQPFFEAYAYYRAEESRRYAAMLLEQIVWRFRFDALKAYLSCAASKVAVTWLTTRLGFEGFDGDELCVEYLEKCRVLLDASGSMVLCRETLKRGSLQMYTPKAKDDALGVTHGSMFAADKDIDSSAAYHKFLRR